MWRRNWEVNNNDILQLAKFAKSEIFTLNKLRGTIKDDHEMGHGTPSMTLGSDANICKKETIIFIWPTIATVDAMAVFEPFISMIALTTTTGAQQSITAKSAKLNCLPPSQWIHSPFTNT